MAKGSGKARVIAGWIITGLLAALFIFASSGKLMGAEEIEENFAKYGLEGKALLIGSGELASAILYVIPFTAALGTLLLSALMGGAIVTHMSHGEPYIFQSIILILVWAGGALRRPEILGDLTKSLRGEHSGPPELKAPSGIAPATDTEE